MNDRDAAPSTSGNDAAERMLARHRARIVEHRRTALDTAEKVKEKKIASDLKRQMPRRWQPGDLYAPHDLSAVEMGKWRKKSPRTGDLIDALNISPVDMYKVSIPRDGLWPLDQETLD
jgi:small subunit ribosomal protein S18